MSSFININNRTVENESKYSATVIKNALLRTETKSSIKANKLVENITEPVSLNEALSVFTDKLRAVNALSESYKEAVATEIMEFNASKEELTLNEGTMSDIHQLANEVKDISSFVKEFFKQFGDKIKKSADSIQWVESLYTDMKTESVITEGRSISKIQKDWSETTTKMSQKVIDWKEAEGDRKTELLDELKALTKRKSELEAELDDKVAGKDKDLALVISEDHSENPNDRYEVRPCDEEGTPFAVWEGDVRVECFATEEEAQAFADKQNKEQGLDEARYNKKSLLKKLGKADDARIQTGNGKEYIIYNPDSNNDDNADMWNDDSVFAVDQDGEEHEIAYKDIGLVLVESSANEAFSRMSNDAIGNELYAASQALTTYYDWLKAGNDAGKGKSIDHIISLLKKCKSSIKRFDNKEETVGTEYEAPAMESTVTEAKFVKDFNRDVLDATTEDDVLKVYPKAEFFIGKSDHFFGEFDENLFFKAYYTKGQKEFEIKSVYSEKGSNYVHLYNESIVNENYEVIYSDGMSQMKKFRNERQALDFMNKEIASNKKLRDIAVYKPGMHSTTQTELVVKFWGEGSYLDNVSKRDKDLAAKKLEESVVTEDVLCEATVVMDAINPDDKDFLKFLKKNKVKVIDTVKSGPTGHPEITMQGKRKDLETVLADGEYGWDDPGLAEYIEESVITKDVKITLDALVEMFETVNEGLRSDIKKFIKDNKKELDELADNEEWDLMHQKLYTEFDVEADTADGKELLKTFELTF